MLWCRCSITFRWSAAPIPASQHITNMTWTLYSESRITCMIQWFLYGFTSASNRSPITVSHQQLITTRHSLGDNLHAKILDQLMYSVYLVVGRQHDRGSSSVPQDDCRLERSRQNMIAKFGKGCSHLCTSEEYLEVIENTLLFFLWTTGCVCDLFPVWVFVGVIGSAEFNLPNYNKQTQFGLWC